MVTSNKILDQHQGRQSWGVGGHDPQILSSGGLQGGCGRVVKYYYILSCTESMFESGDFLKRIRIICPKVAVNGQFLPGQSTFLKLPEKSKFFGNLPAWKNRNSFVKLPEKIEMFRNIAWRNRFFLSVSTTPQISNLIDAVDQHNQKLNNKKTRPLVKS